MMGETDIDDLLISIVTPSFNQALFIENAVKSVAGQSYQNYEHLILDGMSTDGTLEILKTLDFKGSRIRWISERDNGQSSALNKGFGMAQGDIIGWLNSDDSYRDGCFEQIIKAFERYPDVDIIYGNYEFVDVDGNIIKLCRETEFSCFTLFHHRVLHIATIATFFRRRVFDEGNFLNEDLHYAMDLDFLIRLARKGYVIRHINALLADYTLQPESKTCSDPEMFKLEHFRVVCDLVPLVHGFKDQWARNVVVRCGRFVAAVIRYTEKFLRGYYLPGTEF